MLTPNSTHAEVSIAAMESGKHVMCEKPMAKTYAEAKAMVDVAHRTGKVLNIGYQCRYRADAQYLKQACEDGELGDIYFAKALAVRRRAVPTWGVFLDKDKQGGGPLIDMGTHALDMTLWMMDNYEVESVTGSTFQKLADQTNTGNRWGDWDPAKFTVEDSAFGFIKMKNGANDCPGVLLGAEYGGVRGRTDTSVRHEGGSRYEGRTSYQPCALWPPVY